MCGCWHVRVYPAVHRLNMAVRGLLSPVSKPQLYPTLALLHPSKKEETILHTSLLINQQRNRVNRDKTLKSRTYVHLTLIRVYNIPCWLLSINIRLRHSKEKHDSLKESRRLCSPRYSSSLTESFFLFLSRKKDGGVINSTINIIIMNRKYITKVKWPMKNDAVVIQGKKTKQYTKTKSILCF